MAKISTYVIDGTIVDGDKVIGSDANNDMQTKNYTVGDLVNYFAASIGNNFLVPYVGANDDVDLGAFNLSATEISISGNFIANGTAGLPGQALLSQGPSSPAIWGYVTGSQDLASVLSIGNVGGNNINLNTINGYARIDVEKIYGEPAMYLYSDALNTYSNWEIDNLHLESVTYSADYSANKIRYILGANYVDLIINSYNNQSFIFPAVGGYIPISVNGNFADASGNIVVSAGTVTSVTATTPLASSGGATPNITIQQAGLAQDGYLSSSDWNTFDGKQDVISLTTTGTSGAATLIANTLNIPQYAGATVGGSTGNIQYNNGTTFAGSNNLFWDATNNRLGIGTTTPSFALDVNGTGRFTGLLGAQGDFYAGAAGSSQFDINTLSATLPNTLGFWRKFGNGNYTYLKEDEQGGAQHKWAFVRRDGFNQTRSFFQANSSIININLGWEDANSNNYDGNTLLINPKINITNAGITGTKVRGIYYNPTITSLTNTTHTAYENTSGDIIFGNLAGSGTRVVTVDSTGKLNTTTVSSLAVGFEMNFLLMGA